MFLRSGLVVASVGASSCSQDDDMSVMQLHHVKQNLAKVDGQDGQWKRVVDAMAAASKDEIGTICLFAAEGEEAPAEGTFQAESSEVAVTVQQGFMAPSAGKYCIDKQTLALIQRASGFADTASFEHALAGKAAMSTDAALSGKSAESNATAAPKMTTTAPKTTAAPVTTAAPKTTAAHVTTGAPIGMPVCPQVFTKFCNPSLVAGVCHKPEALVVDGTGVMCIGKDEAARPCVHCTSVGRQWKVGYCGQFASHPNMCEFAVTTTAAR